MRLKAVFPSRGAMRLAGLVMLASGVAAGMAVAQSMAPATPRPKIRPPLAAPPGQPPREGVNFGAPLADLGSAEVADFAAGLEEFVAIETPEGGLGPIFNDRSCVACHSAGAPGGASDRTVTRFGRVLADGRFDPLTSQGGSLLQAQAIDPAALEHVPPEANVVAQRLATPLFGAGLIEAIPDETLMRNAARALPDGIHGRAAMVTDVVSGKTRVGRFGWKAQQATLLAFAADAYVNEMGVTNRFFPTENAPNGRADLLARFDLVPDIEDRIDPATGKADIDHAADFMRLLAPPPVRPATSSSLAGARVFDQARCTACHLPSMNTGDSPVRALAHQVVPLFSDLLLHDMGRLGDGIEQGPAKAREMRTAPLWGLRARTSFLHDGRAKTFAQAIEAHDGEAAASRARFLALPPAARQQLLDYLGSL